MLYLAYGSNLDPVQMQERCPGARPAGVARLAGYRLCFPRRSGKRGCGVASIVPAAGGEVWGALYDLTAQHLASLDLAEGYVPGGEPARNRYNRVLIGVDIAGTSTQAWTYLANAEPAPPLPSADYLGHLRRGARAHGLPAAYVDMLDALPCLAAQDRSPKL